MPHPDEHKQKAPRRRLDRDNLPEEFPPEFLSSLLPRDLIWLEGEADLTARQRESFTAWSTHRFRAFNEVGAVTRKMMEGFKLPEGTLGKLFPSTSQVSGLTDMPGPAHNPASYRSRRQHDEVNEAASPLLRQPERQKTMVWVRDVLAVASVAGTFATVNSATNIWYALFATWLAAGILYVVRD